MKKYEFSGETLRYGEVTLHRIRALRNFGKLHRYVKAGDLGGWIEKEDNLSHDGDAWVAQDAIVMGEAKVFDDGFIMNSCRVREAAQVHGSATVAGEAEIYGSAQIYGEAVIDEMAEVYDKAEVFDSAIVRGKASVFESAKVYGKASLTFGLPHIYGTAQLCGKATAGSHAQIKGGIWNTPPLYIQGSDGYLGISSESEVDISRHLATWQEWHDEFSLVLSDDRYTSERTSTFFEYVQYFNLACGLYGHQDCMVKLHS